MGTTSVKHTYYVMPSQQPATNHKPANHHSAIEIQPLHKMSPNVNIVIIVSVRMSSANRAIPQTSLNSSDAPMEE